MANPQDWPSKSEIYGTFPTLSARLDDLDTHVAAAGGPSGPLPSALVATDLALVDRGGTVYSAEYDEVWRQDASGGGAITQGYQSSFAHGYAQGAGSTVVASGVASHAFGQVVVGGDVIASGNGSFAHGRSTYGAVQATNTGASARGYAYYTGSTIEATGVGSDAHGHAVAGGTITAGGYGTKAFGRATNGVIQASERGSMAMGFSYNGSSQISASAPGAFALGYAYGGGQINAVDWGAIASGATDTSGSVVQAGGKGSHAVGFATGGNDVFASGDGSLAVGLANTATVEATAANSVQFGPGTNATANTVQVGDAGLRFKGTAGAPGVLQNGDIWVASGNVYVRTNGVTKNLTNVP